MKSNPSPLALNWNSPLEALPYGGTSNNIQKLIEAKITSLGHLLWILPNKIDKAPAITSFFGLRENIHFRGIGQLVRYQSRPQFWARGRKSHGLDTVSIVVKDAYSKEMLNLSWFNCYKSLSSKLKNCQFIVFQGKVQIYKNRFQIVNPSFYDILQEEIPPLDHIRANDELIVEYPTVNSVFGKQIQKIIGAIPLELWDTIEDPLPEEIVTKRSLLSLEEALKIFHGKTHSWSQKRLGKASERIIYQEFFDEQIKIFLRKQKNEQELATPIEVPDSTILKLKNFFPYTLTADQHKALEDIRQDMSTASPMMRLIQGDVGCGKTCVAVIAALMACENGYQSALLCPTEALACQHYLNIEKWIGNHQMAGLLLGSMTTKEKKVILRYLKEGKINFIVGTHALIQSTVEFKHLALAVIDEQHKFGVHQRLKLLQKTPGCHCLMMSATPIPRSLRLTQYGDLDITTIKMMPKGRRGYKTRIVTPKTFYQFLSFVKTRLSMGEQVMVVVPTIEESETLDVENLEKTLSEYSTFFCEFKTAGIHGRLKSEEKQSILDLFRCNEINLLVATSVVEVGIDVPNATVMAILSPERFGLSSLHQLRGRIGRGEKMGFCFLVSSNFQSFKRLRIIEKYTDGLKIAEEDLKIRGEGDLFGTTQSGEVPKRKMANIILHQKQLVQAREDVEAIIKGEQDLNAPIYQSKHLEELILHTV